MKAFALLMLVTIAPAFGHDFVETASEDGPGIYFDPVGKIKMSSDRLEVVTFVDLNFIRDEFPIHMTALVQVEVMCNIIKLIDSDNPCMEMITSLGSIMKENSIQIKELLSSESTNRFKRWVGGSFMLVTQVAQSFFDGLIWLTNMVFPGYEKYERAINALSAEQDMYYHNVSEKFSVFNSSIIDQTSSLEDIKEKLDIFQKAFQEFNKMLAQKISFSEENRIILKNHKNTLENLDFKNNRTSVILDEYGAILTKHVDILKNHATEIENLKLESNMISLLMSMKVQFDAFQNKLKTIRNAVILSKSNVFDSAVVNSKELHQVLIDSATGENDELPLYPSLNNIERILRMSDVTCKFMNMTLLFVLNVPLVSKMEYMLYNCVPYPVRIGDFFLFVQSFFRSSHLALSNDKLSYSYVDFDDCSELYEGTRMCVPKNIHSTEKRPTCDTKLLTKQVLSLPKECDLRVMYGNIDFWHKLDANRWSFVQSSPKRLSIDCDGSNSYDELISGSGIINLPKNCNAYSGANEFRADGIDLKNLTSPKVLFPLYKDDCCTVENLETFRGQMVPLEMTHSDISFVKKNSYRMPKDKLENRESVVPIIAYISIALVILVLSLIVMYKIVMSKIRRMPRNNLAMQMLEHVRI
ncbi:uncharacterized protein LOC143918931 isoform X2 [Arctopsyche grandis]|uniref:uncharacterized protein LOC143918931 isoform X2 n=1 Tax=Arctopsyche grandis TaxID=121162 RepID=UPI00406D952C